MSSAQRNLFDQQMQLEDELIEQKQPRFTPKKMPAPYRIQRKNGTFVGAGTDTGSWFTLQEAKLTVKYDHFERIIEHDGVNILWEVL